MPTRLDERAELTMLIDRLNYKDIHKLSIFLAGLEAGKEIYRAGHVDKPETTY